MKATLIVLTFTCFPLSAAAEDLSKVDRSLVKEPAYQSSSPRYCMLAFGPELKARAWLILDGDILYLDRNGNGDLTEPGERLDVCLINKDMASPLVLEGHHFVDLVDPMNKTFSQEDRDVPTLKGIPTYKRFSVDEYIPNKRYLPRTPEETQLALNFARNLKGFIDVNVAIAGKSGQRGRARFASTAIEAPVIHFDGPMAFEFYSPDRTRPKLVRDKSTDLILQVVTRGLGDGTVTYLDHGSIPKDINPVAEIEYPNSETGETIREKLILDVRRGNEAFSGVTRVPARAGIGTAKIRFTFPGLGAADVAPTVMEVSVD